MTLSNSNIRQAASLAMSMLDDIVFPTLPIPPIEMRCEWRKHLPLVRQNAVNPISRVNDDEEGKKKYPPHASGSSGYVFGNDEFWYEGDGLYIYDDDCYVIGMISSDRMSCRWNPRSRYPRSH